MLEPPEVSERDLVACLGRDFGVDVDRITFLPIGADQYAAAYRVDAKDGTTAFLKLRSEGFDEVSVVLPKFLSEQGIRHVIPPFATSDGRLCVDLRSFKAILYPYVPGRNAYEADLAAHHWDAFGRTLRCIHTLALPSDMVGRIRCEGYSGRWRDELRSLLGGLDDLATRDSLTEDAASLLRAQRPTIHDLLSRTGRLAGRLQAVPRPFTLCHSDIHAGNLLIGDDGGLYIVDWDEVVLAPKERDLMYIGGGLLSSGLSPEEEEVRFYRAYGDTQVDPVAIAYYRYERIIEDIAVFSELLLLSDRGGTDRMQSLTYLAANFQPNGTIDIAHRMDRT